MIVGVTSENQKEKEEKYGGGWVDTTRSETTLTRVSVPNP